jgi:cysteinyl-tRNA synthetase
VRACAYPAEIFQRFYAREFLVTSSIHTDLHHDHIIWKAEVSQWRDDIDLWENELDKAEAQLKDLEKALKAHREALSAHASAIREREKATDLHERAIAAYEAGETGEELPAMAIGHQQELEKQAQQRSSHDRIRRYHHALIATWSLLLKALRHEM